ncbi:uncharacterized protein A1O5_05478 [Cladophialophora psammophila CBS 110553]|uniref:Aspartate aminotransferase n=1 Tax=Cladophialophora psammophila CBS 110553 TaxID=1182543 RepID=W9X2X9_9EURO|nr:uncharacterized protein A1O5_05478 [Cladophialophora psammophila CBS 110553]EXJ71670.1 hypothetical protein A1O5_05478 [Cladophialophora psammophila CBS 110553]
MASFLWDSACFYDLALKAEQKFKTLNSGSSKTLMRRSLPLHIGKRSQSVCFFAAAPRLPKDAIFALTAECRDDLSPVKVNLGQGSYHDENGFPWVLPAVCRARRRLARLDLDHEYLPILGLPEFRAAAAELVFGTESYAAIRPRIATCQSLSGTGSLHLAGPLIRNCSSLNRQVWISEPTWSNHHLVFSSLGCQVRAFRYYNPEAKALDMNSYLDALRSAEPKSIIILYACAHNPTGCDPTQDQWKEIGEIIKERQLFPLFDAAYLGFRPGNFNKDTFSIRYFVNNLGLEAAVAVSFTKNMGLYGERVGATIFGQVRRDCTELAKIAAQILRDPFLRKMWFEDLKTMSNRISLMRKTLYNLLVKNGAPGTWDHFVQQLGMLGFLGLTHDVVLTDQYHIYLADNSRISIAGLNESNVAYVARAITECLQAASPTEEMSALASHL